MKILSFFFYFHSHFFQIFLHFFFQISLQFFPLNFFELFPRLCHNTMPRKGSPAASGSGHANIRAFFTASTPLREVTNNTTTISAAQPQRAAPAAANPESNQIHAARGNARANAGGSAHRVQRQRAEEEGEEVDYSGTCPCILHVCSTR